MAAQHYLIVFNFRVVHFTKSNHKKIITEFILARSSEMTGSLVISPGVRYLKSVKDEIYFYDYRIVIKELEKLC